MEEKINARRGNVKNFSKCPKDFQLQVTIKINEFTINFSKTPLKMMSFSDLTKKLILQKSVTDKNSSKKRNDIKKVKSDLTVCKSKQVNSGVR